MTNVYVHVNNDEADRILVDPAYKLEKMQKQYQSFYSHLAAYSEISAQGKEIMFRVKQPLAKEIYESWYQVEKEIKKFDRIWNKVEKFDARHMSDPDNHERRQARLDERKKERDNHFVVFTGGLSE